MKKDSLHKECMKLCIEMLCETTGSETKASGEVKGIEWKNGDVVQSWFRVERMADGYQFVSDEEEFCFMMMMQPEFSGCINFLQYYIDPLVAAG